MILISSELHTQLTTGTIFSAKKKQTMLIVTDINDLVANSVYQRNTDDEIIINTDLYGHNEATSKAINGDWIACGADKELYVIKESNFTKLYDVSKNIAIPSQIKFFLKVNLSESLDWTNAWNESKSIPPNTDYYLMANNEDDLKNLNMTELNPMALGIFEKTY